MLMYRRIIKISWKDRTSNETVLNRLNTGRELIWAVEKRKLQHFGHFMRSDKYQLLQLIIQGKIKGTCKPGRRGAAWLKNLREWFKMDTKSLFRAVVDRVKITMIIINLRYEIALKQ